jgi:predicted DNA-binding protein with PD1-like motif
MNKNIEYKLQDFYVACVLKTVGFKLLRLEKSTGRFFLFVFDDSEELAEYFISQYWNRQIEVCARDLIETINELKTRLHSSK